MTGFMKRRTCRLFEGVGALCAAFAVVALLLPGSGQALVSQVSCGATITTDTQLDSDLANCPSNGIVIGADNITLDLNGHTVSGDGAPVAVVPRGGVLRRGHRQHRRTHAA